MTKRKMPVPTQLMIDMEWLRDGSSSGKAIRADMKARISRLGDEFGFSKSEVKAAIRSPTFAVKFIELMRLRYTASNRRFMEVVIRLHGDSAAERVWSLEALKSIAKDEPIRHLREQAKGVLRGR